MEQKTGIVMLIGVLDQKGSTNIPMALALMNLGLNVIPINYRTLMGRYGSPFFEKLVLSITEQTKPELVLVCKGNGIRPQLIAELTQRTKIWIYNMDPQSTIDRCPEVMENARIATFSSCTASDMAEAWRKIGANCFHIIQGVDEEIFKPRKPVKKYKADISLIGSKTPIRDQAKEYFENAGIKAKFYGPGYTDKPIFEEEFAKVCSSSKYMLSIDSVVGEHKNYFSNRLLRYLSCGACTFHLDPTDSLKPIFEHDTHLVYFDTIPDLIGKMNFLNEYPDKAYQIAMNGMDLVNNLTWKNIMRTIYLTACPELQETNNAGASR